MEALGQLILTGVPGKELDAATAAVFRRIQPGGFILFGRNIESPTQLRKLIDDLRNLSATEPIITIDQEGGRVSRLRLIGNEPPNAQQMRDKENVDLIRWHGDITGRLLRLFGFNLNLCPVLDISFDDEADNSLRGRCYGKSADEVVRNASVFNDAMRQQGMTSCGKHFPGYSAATLDAHHDLPRIDRTREQLDREELAVFRAFMGRGGSPEPPALTASQTNEAIEVNRPYLERPEAIEVNRPYLTPVDSMMICHGWYPCFDTEKTPASLSRRVVTELLREDLGFDGLIMTDDLDMGAILNEYSLEDTLRLALEAGNDLAMICHRIDQIENANRILSGLSASDIDRAMASVARFKQNLVPPDPFSEEAFQTIDNEIWQLRVDTLGAQRAAERSPEDGKRSPVELY